MNNVDEYEDGETTASRHACALPHRVRTVLRICRLPPPLLFVVLSILFLYLGLGKSYALLDSHRSYGCIHV